MTEKNSLKKLKSQLVTLTDPGCSLCKISEETDRVCIPVNPPRRLVSREVSGQKEYLRLLIVGEAPGASEERTGRLFSGAAGEYLDKQLREVGLKREWFYVTNAVKCRPTDNRTPTAKEIRTCVSNYLRPEVEAIQPTYGLALGNGGLQATLGKKGITKANGSTYEAMGVTWVAAFHPAAVLRNPRNERPFTQALLVFSRLVKNEEGVPITETVTVNTKDKLRELIEEIEAADVGSLDVETWSPHPGVGRFKGGGLAWWDPDFKISTINFSFTPGKAYVLPVHHREAPWRDPDKVLRILAPHIESGIEWVMHNGKYDSKCLEVSGINARHSFDTMGAYYALDENNIKDLGFMSQVFLGAPEYKEMVDKSKMLTEPLEEIVEYGGRDSDYTLRLGSIMKRRLSNSLEGRLYHKLLHPADVCLTDVELRGMPLDDEKLWDRSNETDKIVSELIERMEEIVGHKFNPNSPQQVGQVLYNELGFPVLKRTAKGAPSTDESVLLQLQDLDDGEMIEAMLEYRLWAGRQSRYFKPWPVLADDEMRIHPHFKPYHTVTGRLSCEHPNLQQVPRDPFMRGIFGGRPGWTIIDADYSQVELRIVAHYTQDKAMLRAYTLGRDIHMETAMAITGLTEDEIDSETRKKAKAVNFGFVYGMGAKKFQSYARDNYGVKVTYEEAKRVRKDYFAQFSALHSWHQRQRSAAKRRGWVVSAIGRKRHLHDIRSTNESIRAEAERQAINSPVQSLASDMMLLAMTEANDRFLPDECRVLCSVHDSIIFECRDDLVDKYVPRIRAVMEDYVLETMETVFESRLTVPIKADFKIGSHWSEGAQEL